MTAVARRIGRPGQQASGELLRHILAVARGQFVKNGFAGTSLDQIAAIAGSGKQTIYRHFSSKEGLFLEVIRREMLHLSEVAGAAQADAKAPLDALRQCCRLLFDFALDDGMISLSRILIAEAARFPELERDTKNWVPVFRNKSRENKDSRALSDSLETPKTLGEYVFDTCLAPFKARMVRVLTEARDAGEISFDDVDLTFDLLRGLLLGTPVQRMLLGSKTFGEQAGRDRYFMAAWQIFVDGLARR